MISLVPLIPTLAKRQWRLQDFREHKHLPDRRGIRVQQIRDLRAGGGFRRDDRQRFEFHGRGLGSLFQCLRSRSPRYCLSLPCSLCGGGLPRGLLNRGLFRRLLLLSSRKRRLLLASRDRLLHPLHFLLCLAGKSWIAHALGQFLLALDLLLFRTLLLGALQQRLAGNFQPLLRRHPLQRMLILLLLCRLLGLLWREHPLRR